MRELRLALFDDLEAAAGLRVEADTVRRLSLDGKEVELDLTAEHAEELDEILAPYLKAGQRTEKVTTPPGGTAARNEYNELMRGFSDRYEGTGWNGRNFRPYRQMDKGGYYYPKSLQATFATYMAEHAA